MMAHPFLPMTNEILKKLTRVVKDLNSTEKSPESQPVFETQNLQTAIELNPQHSETNQSNLRTNNRY